MDERRTHDDAPMIDLTGDDSFLPGRAHNRVKQEMVDGVDGSNDEDDTMPQLRHQNDGDNSSDEEDDDVDEEYSEPNGSHTPLCMGNMGEKAGKAPSADSQGAKLRSRSGIPPGFSSKSE